jgi:aspartate racemase
MSWENTIEYYQIINEMVKERLGGWNSAKIMLYSVNFEEILPLQNNNQWDKIARKMIKISMDLESVGCAAIVICSNSMHNIAEKIEDQISIPLIHVVDETAKAIKNNNLKTIGLLGTKFTMEGGFYVQRLFKKHNITVIVPEPNERDYIHEAIYTEFAVGKFLDSTKDEFLEIIANLKEKGAQGIILGCTEIPMLIKPTDVNIILFDTLRLHLNGAVEFALA